MSSVYRSFLFQTIQTVVNQGVIIPFFRYQTVVSCSTGGHLRLYTSSSSTCTSWRQRINLHAQRGSVQAIGESRQDPDPNAYATTSASAWGTESGIIVRTSSPAPPITYPPLTDDLQLENNIPPPKPDPSGVRFG